MLLGESIFRNDKSDEKKIAVEDSLRLAYLEQKIIPVNDFYWYLESVEVDTYIKEESRFEVRPEVLPIKLPPVMSLAENGTYNSELSIRLFQYAQEQDEPIHLLKVLSENSEIADDIGRVYAQYFNYLHRFDSQIEQFRDGNARALEIAVYITETLLKFEPSYISLRYLGDFHTFNLNWLLAKMNRSKEMINLEPDTVEYLIKRCDLFGGDYAFDETYQALSALFLHKARYEY